MKRRQIMKWMMAAAFSAAVMTGCGQKEAETPEPAAEEQTAETETEETEEEIDPEFSVDTEEPEVQAGPLRIYGTITGAGEGELIVDNTSGVSSAGEMILMIDPESTYLLDGTTGLPVEVEDVQNGNFAAYISDVMTMSLPPQNTPYAVIVNLAEDAVMPAFAVAAEAPVEADGIWTLKTADGTTYEIAEDTQVVPYRTRNIVKMQDVQEGSACMLWLDADNQVEKVMLLSDGSF